MTKPTDDDFRATGFAPQARAFPRDEFALELFAAFNNVPVSSLPPAAHYFPNQATQAAWSRVADAAFRFVARPGGPAPSTPSPAEPSA